MVHEIDHLRFRDPPGADLPNGSFDELFRLQKRHIKPLATDTPGIEALLETALDPR